MDITASSPIFEAIPCQCADLLEAHIQFDKAEMEFVKDRDTEELAKKRDDTYWAKAYAEYRSVYVVRSWVQHRMDIFKAYMDMEEASVELGYARGTLPNMDAKKIPLPYKQLHHLAVDMDYAAVTAADAIDGWKYVQGTCYLDDPKVQRTMKEAALAEKRFEQFACAPAVRKWVDARFRWVAANSRYRLADKYLDYDD